MKTKELLSLLKENSNRSLRFEYQPNQFVKHGYHITEIKHVKIDSVDCGAGTDAWNETIIQLWEDPNHRNETSSNLTCFKALGILNKVGRIKPFDLDAEVKFEYGNTTFHTAHLSLTDYTINEDTIILHLGTNKTLCKAEEKCGINIEDQPIEACCSPSSDCC